MSYNNLIKLANKRNEEKKPGMATYAPAALGALGAGGIGLGYARSDARKTIRNRAELQGQYSQADADLTANKASRDALVKKKDDLTQRTSPLAKKDYADSDRWSRLDLRKDNLQREYDALRAGDPYELNKTPVLKAEINKLQGEMDQLEAESVRPKLNKLRRESQGVSDDIRLQNLESERLVGNKHKLRTQLSSGLDEFNEAKGMRNKLLLGGAALLGTGLGATAFMRNRNKRKQDR